MEEFSKKTKADGNVTEIQRLAANHEVFTHGLGGKLTLTPLDLSKPGLKILDSACADGTWLRDLARHSPAAGTASYVGFDINPGMFQSEKPNNVGSMELVQQSILDPYPEAWKSSFDLVHQRLTMAAWLSTPKVEILGRLVELAKPGTGYVELMELDPNTGTLPDNVPKYRRFIELIGEVFDSIGFGRDTVNNMKTLLAQAGCADVVEIRTRYKVGATADPQLQEKSIRGQLGAIPALAMVAKQFKTSFSEEELGTLESDARKELETIGAEFEMVTVWGKRA
ncbi:uncharacterized protein Z518_09950 [Rhinocladiella mackenziei CBS 650.93]|uniref:Methyltransferase domain-containing protein n=1 Tax=Rhinocladiella mackenziei CBS 650.93 TaxID=1442369 RepID=A0A0D2IW20_9EURO|nr:uncharacterized protein Z518_09950 [Rhinocladiella mackenziei CBS 650.93]KIX00885.1 hypothetical protein Z518_09950 [Rhinocladiella mackenziei CBS 650.93]